MIDNCVMDVEIVNEAGFDQAMLSIAMNKKKYDRDMIPVSLKLYDNDEGHNKFLEFMSVWIVYTAPRYIHQEIDTYRIGISKSSESTNHMLIEDTLESCIDRKKMTKAFNEMGFEINTTKCVDGLVPINNTALLISNLQKINKNLLNIINDNNINGDLIDIINKNEVLGKSYVLINEYINKYFSKTIELSLDVLKKIIIMLVNSFHVNYKKYFSLFEGGSDSIDTNTIDKLVDCAMTMEENRIEKLHTMKKLLPEGFLQKRIIHCNYKNLRHIIKQRFHHPMVHWQEFCRQIILNISHPEYFNDILTYFHTSKEELKNHMCDGKPYGIPRYK